MTDYLGGSKLRLEGISHPRESLVAQTEDTRNPHCPIRRKSFLNDRQLYEHLSIYHPDIFECPKPNVITREIQHFLMKDNEASVSCSDNEYYPESFALEEEEQPLLGVYDESGPSDFFSQISGLETFSWVLKRLHQKNVSPEEVMLLWYHFLTEKQRQCTLKQLEGICLGYYSLEASKILDKTTLSDMIKAWADLKQQVPSKLRQSYFPAQQIAMNILRYCIVLEKAKAQGLPMALSCGFVESDPFLHRHITGINFARDIPLDRLVEAFTERIRCRKVHAEWLSFTNIMVLREMAKYVRDLKEITRMITRFLNVEVRTYLQSLED